MELQGPRRHFGYPVTRSSGKCWSRSLWTGRSPAATQAWHQRERTDVLSGDWHLSTSAYFFLYDHVHGPIQPGIQESTEGQGTPAATGHGPYSLPVTLGNDISSNKDNYESEQNEAGED